MTLEWKKSDDWLVIRRHVSRRALMVLFSGAQPSSGELAALRRISDELDRLPVAEIKGRVGTAGTFDLGEHGRIEAGIILRTAQREGLAIREELRSRTEFLPMNRTLGTAWLIEDPDECRQVCLAMIDAGCPVQDEEED